MNFFDIGFIIASVVCAVGIVRRLARWCGKPTSEVSVSSLSWHRRLFLALKTFFLEIVLLGRTCRTGRIRWLAHCLVFFGFMGLLLFHAMDDTITVRFFPAYESTLDPWQFLRNLFGGMTLIGLALMVYRRVRFRSLRSLTRFQDWAALLVVGGIILSGFLLEASKIMSPAVFDVMVYDYFIPDDGTDITALKAVWAKKYGVVFPEEISDSDDVFEKGLSLNEDSCVDCHSDTTSAFISRPLASALHPLAPALNRSRADEVFWYLHITLCLIALAALPFGKFFHPLTTPANLMARLGRRDAAKDEVASPAVRGLGIDACTRCGECSLHCSVAPAFSVLGNSNILPSEKLISLKGFESEASLSGQALEAFAEGSRICTECLRCTDICPSGINLQDLWMASKKAVSKVAPDSNQAIRLMEMSERAAPFGECSLPPISGLADNKESYLACVQCTTCTSVCPVVAVSEDPSRDLDLLPQQIMNLLRMGLKEQTLGARMVWSCTTCYKCQEHCPQNIRVADVLYELRNTVATRLREGECADERDG
ncbi:MAG: 4Fe-4S dicluster domain-containing protein [Pseudodesulfovibrio sp.]